MKICTPTAVAFARVVTGASVAAFTTAMIYDGIEWSLQEQWRLLVYINGSMTKGRTPHSSRRLSQLSQPTCHRTRRQSLNTPVPGDNGTLMRLDTLQKGRNGDKGEGKEKEKPWIVSWKNASELIHCKPNRQLLRIWTWSRNKNPSFLAGATLPEPSWSERSHDTTKGYSPYPCILRLS